VASSFFADLPQTRFRRLRRGPALVVALVTLLAMGVLATLAVAYHGPPAAIVSSPGAGDLATYSQIVDDMRHGETYYAAAHKELVAGHYGTRSVFNWRLPTLSWAWSALPSNAWAKGVLLAWAGVAIIAAFLWFNATAGLAAALLVIPALLFNMVACLPDGAELLADVVAGVFILISVAAYGMKWRPAGFIAAMLALSIKELAAPYVAICVVEAWRQRRYAELGAWLVGLAAFGGYFLWHDHMVHAQIAATDIAYKDGWLQFGGLRFVLATAGFNGLLLAGPLWITAVVLPLCILGLAAWDGHAGDRVRFTVAAYLAIYLFVGKPFDVYWGALYTPLMMLGLPFLPCAFADLAAALRWDGNRPAPTAPASP
jgi:hypothetical protein